MSTELDVSVAAAIPVIKVANAAASAAFYRDLLGFRIEWEQQFERGLPKLICVVCNGCRIFLSEYPQAPKGSIYLFVRNLHDAFERAKTHGIEVVEPPHVQSYGHEMRLFDLDGNELRISEPAYGN